MNTCKNTAILSYICSNEKRARVKLYKASAIRVELQ